MTIINQKSYLYR